MNKKRCSLTRVILFTKEGRIISVAYLLIMGYTHFVFCRWYLKKNE